MSKSVYVSLLRQGNTGNEILSILDTLVADNVSGYEYIESPMIEQVLGIPTLEEVSFWLLTTVLPLVYTEGSYYAFFEYPWQQCFGGVWLRRRGAMRYIIFWVPLSYKTLKTRTQYHSL